MTLRGRILAASGLLIALPLLVLAFGFRGEMNRRITALYTDRVHTLVQIIEEDLGLFSRDLGDRLQALKVQTADDNRFRLAIVSRREDLRPYLLDYAGNAMALMGLDVLQLQDESGTIISSGHYRNEYDRQEPSLPRLLTGCPNGSAAVIARRATGPFVALCRVDSLRLGNRLFHLVGGIEIDGQFLATLTRDRELAVSLAHSAGAISSDPALGQRLRDSAPVGMDDPGRILSRQEYLLQWHDLPLVSSATASARRLETARLIVTHPVTPLLALLRSLDLWLILLMAAVLAGTLLLAVRFSSTISRPLHELAHQTADLDLDRLDVAFATDRRDEVGVLSRFLAAMTDRLRSSAVRLREAERRATVGELARQVNHDVRNGLTPIRNVFRHLSEVADADPERLGGIFAERRQTVAAGLSYLEDLASHYARLSPAQNHTSCDLDEIVRTTVEGQPTGGRIVFRMQRAGNLPLVTGDPVGLRRILENLLRNAAESLPDAGGVITITTASGNDDDRDTVTDPGVILGVSDDGCGITAEDLDRIFTDFYTTKPDGSGLGLSIVRRLVADYGGAITVASEPGRGTRFAITLPAAASPDPATADADPDVTQACEGSEP